MKVRSPPNSPPPPKKKCRAVQSLQDTNYVRNLLLLDELDFFCFRLEVQGLEGFSSYFCRVLSSLAAATEVKGIRHSLAFSEDPKLRGGSCPSCDAQTVFWAKGGLARRRSLVFCLGEFSGFHSSLLFAMVFCMVFFGFGTWPFYLREVLVVFSDDQHFILAEP